jgi:hypothetical protein
MSEIPIPADPDPKEKSPEKRRIKEKSTPLQYAILIILTLIAFGPLMFSDALWSSYDPAGTSSFTELSSWTEAWSPERIRQDDPFTLSSYFLEQSLPFDPAFTHRAINIALHLLAACLLWSFLRKLRLIKTWPAVLVFTLHPAVLPVLFWPGYRDVLLGLILMLAALNIGTETITTRRYLLLSIICALGIIVHSNLFFLPVILALVTYCKHHPPALSNYSWLLPIFCLCLFLGVWVCAKNTLEGSPFVLSEWSYSSGYNLQFVLQQTFLPSDLIFFKALPTNSAYSVNTSTNLAPFLLFPPFIILAALNRKHRWARFLLLAVCSYLLLVMPAVSVNQPFIDGSPSFELFSYYFALAIITVSCIFMLARISSKMGQLFIIIRGPLFIILILVECAFSFSFAYEARNSLVVWQSISEQWPNSARAQVAYLDCAIRDDTNNMKRDKLILMMQGLLEKDPSRIDIRKSLARTLRDANQPNNALREFRRILRTGTEDPVFLNEAADFLAFRNLDFEAEKARQRASEAKP